MTESPSPTPGIGQQTIQQYLEVLGSDAPTPGGGAVAGLTGAQGIALLQMVLDLSKDEPFGDEKTECRELRNHFVDLAESDMAAFDKVRLAYGLPKETGPEKEQRSAAIQSALTGATDVPLATMRTGLRGLDVAAKLIDRINPHVVSDLAIAVTLLRATVEAASYNVSINVNSLKDKARAETYGLESQRLLTEAGEKGAALQKQVEVKFQK